MNRARAALGLVAGGIILLSSAAHSLLGWPQLRSALASGGTGADLLLTLTLGWHFGGVAMIVFGAMIIATFADAIRGRPVSLLPIVLIGLGYLAYGSWALVVSDFSPFFLVFLVPGALLLAAAWKPATAPSTESGAPR